MTLERRLQHAARELRAVDVAVPPLDSGPPSMRGGARRRLGLPVVAVPMLFIVGGLVVMGVVGERRAPGSTFADTPAVAQPAPDLATSRAVAGDIAESVSTGTPTVAAAALAEPTAAAERAVIDRILSAAARTAPEPAAAPAAVRLLRYADPL